MKRKSSMIYKSLNFTINAHVIANKKYIFDQDKILPNLVSKLTITDRNIVDCIS